MRFRSSPLLRVVFSLAAVLAVVALIDVRAVAARLADLHPGWVLGALALSVVQVAGSAWRWRFTAGTLGVSLPLGRAIREYYMAALLNQTVPGGVVGDVSRAVRHAGLPTRGEQGMRAVHAVVLERLSGQIVVAGAAGVSALVLLTPVGGVVAVGVGLLATTGMLMGLPPLSTSAADDAPGFRASARRALLNRSVLPVQLASSLFVLATCVGTYVMAARAVGIGTPVTVLLPLVTPVLLSMLLPVSVGGWGVREGAAAVIWSSAGLTAADGVAISVAYGVLVLMGTLPGLWMLARGGFRTEGSRRTSGRDRRGGPVPGGRVARQDVGPGSAPPPVAG